jgi:hypothetical protein
MKDLNEKRHNKVNEFIWCLGQHMDYKDKENSNMCWLAKGKALNTILAKVQQKIKNF